MSSIQRQRKLIIEIYNQIVNEKASNPLQLLQSTIDTLQNEGANIAEMALLFSLKSDFLFESGLFDEAYKCAMNAYRMDSERKEVLHSLLNLYTPRSPASAANHHPLPSNQYEDDEKAQEYAVKLEQLHTNDSNALFMAAQCYSTLGLYEDALRVLKQAYFKCTSSMKQKCMDGKKEDESNKQFVEEIKKCITQNLVDRYTNCPNNAHESIIRHLIELIEWKFNKFGEENLRSCIEEIWERIEYLLGKHHDLISDENVNRMNCVDVDGEWQKMWKLLCFIPCSIPLSVKLLNLIYDIFCQHGHYEAGIEFFSRLITEYQTYNDNMLSLYAKFEKYSVLYVNRAKLYKQIGEMNEMMEDIDSANTFLLYDENDGEQSEQVTALNLMNYVIVENDEQPIIETVQQIKKRRASRLSNITISPMPKQYRDTHFTPKSSSERTTKSNRASIERFDRDEAKDSEETTTKSMKQEVERLQSENMLLENRIIDIKNDLFRERTMQREQSKKMTELKEEIVRLTERLDVEIAANIEKENKDESECLLTSADGEIQESATPQSRKEDYMEIFVQLKEDITRRDVVICELRMENQRYCSKIESLQRELAILRDCQKKHSVAVNNKKKQIAKKSEKEAVNLQIAKPVPAEAQESKIYIVCKGCWRFTRFSMAVIGFFAVLLCALVLSDGFVNIQWD